MVHNLEPMTIDEMFASSRDVYCDYVLNGRLAVEKVRETDRVLAFHHPKPNWDLHIVLIPKEHITKLVEITDASLLGEFLDVAINIIRDLGLADSNYKIITNGGSYQYSQHVHFHLVSGKPKVDYGE